MAFVIIDSKEIAAIRERLHNGKLTSEDTRLVDLLLSRAQRMAEIQASAGRLTVDHLPIGMDLVK